MKIYIGADHRGFSHKEHLKKWLLEKGYKVVDAGADKYDKDDDFPDFAFKVAKKVSGSGDVGVLLCGSGGMALAANKVKGIRAVEAWGKKWAEHAKKT